MKTGKNAFDYYVSQFYRAEEEPTEAQMIKELADKRLHSIRLELKRLELEWRMEDSTYDSSFDNGQLLGEESAYNRFRRAARPLEREYDQLICKIYTKEELQPNMCKKCGLRHTKELIHSHSNN
jgi:predicted Zn-ribbon and HTH transcriptional regulator